MTRLTLGIRDDLYPADIKVVGGLAVFQMDKPIPYGPYAGQVTIKIPLREDYGIPDAAGTIINQTIESIKETN